MHASTGTGVSSTKVVRLKKCEGGFKGNIKKIIDVLLSVAVKWNMKN